MAPKKKQPPFKLDWLERVCDWLKEQTDLPEGVTQVNARSMVLALSRSAWSRGGQGLASARWLAGEAQVKDMAALRFRAYLVEHGWLTLTGKTFRKAPYFVLTIPEVSTPGETEVSTRGETLNTGNRERVSPQVSPQVSTRGETTSRLPYVVGEEGGAGNADASPPQNKNQNLGEEKKLIVEWLERWQHLAESFNLDPDHLDIENPDLVIEYRRLQRWDWGDLKTAIPMPKQIKTSVTGWFLAALRKLPADPVDNTKVAEDRIDNLIMDLSDPDPAFRKALKQASTRAEKAAVLVWELDEYETVLALVERHGYRDDNGWTPKARQAFRKARHEFEVEG